MQQHEFDNTHWGAKMTCSHRGIKRDIVSISFEEKLVGLSEIAQGADENDVEWVRCENIVLLK